MANLAPPPAQSAEAERGVCSALLQGADDPLAIQGLAPNDFFDELYGRLFARCKSMLEDGEPLVITAIADSMKLDDVERVRLYSLPDPLLHIRKPAEELPSYIRIVKRAARERALKKICDRVAGANGDVSGLVLDLKAKAEGFLEALHGEPKGGLVVNEIQDFMASDFPDAEPIVRLQGSDTPVFTLSSINQIFAWRGTGKTMLALGLGVGMAQGTELLRWRPTRRIKVLYVEGESRNSQLQQRLRALAKGRIDPGYFRLLTYASQINGIPALSTSEGRAAIEAETQDAEVLFLDSVSTLGRFPTNEEESWIDFLSWLNHLRQRGFCVIFLHHAGKSGMQRGHSRSEDMLDVSIKLTREGEEECDWLKCKFEYDKFRDNPKGIRSLIIEYKEGEWYCQALEVEKLAALKQYIVEHPKASNRTIARELPELGSHMSVQRLRLKLDEQADES
jgi:hypothetical protein